MDVIVAECGNTFGAPDHQTVEHRDGDFLKNLFLNRRAVDDAEASESGFNTEGTHVL